jgi:hypothetical protein
MTEEEKRFLLLGVEKYCDALRAIRHFQRKLQKMAFDALAGSIGDLSTVLGSPPDAARIEPYLYPSNPEAGWRPDKWESNGYVTVALPCTSNWKFHAGVQWELVPNGSQVSYATTFFQAWTKGLKERLLIKVRNITPAARFDIDSWGWEVHMRAPFRSDAILELPNNLNALISEWVRLLREIGGLQTI